MRCRKKIFLMAPVLGKFMLIREAVLNDMGLLREVKPYLDSIEMKRRISEQGQNKAKFLIAEEKGKIVGFCFLKWYGKKTHPEYPDMEDLYVEESKRGGGVGSTIIKECETLVKKRGFKKIGLAVNPLNNKNAKRFYEKLGYKCNVSKSYIDGIYNGVEDWVVDMEKELL